SSSQTPSWLLSRLSLRQPPAPQLLRRNAREIRLDVEDRCPIQHIDAAYVHVRALASKHFDHSQANRVRTPWGSGRKHPVWPIVRWWPADQFKPLRAVELPNHEHVRKAF